MLKDKLSGEIITIETGKKLPLMESFYTIQGEGCHSGKAHTLFVWLAAM